MSNDARTAYWEESVRDLAVQLARMQSDLATMPACTNVDSR